MHPSEHPTWQMLEKFKNLYKTMAQQIRQEAIGDFRNYDISSFAQQYHELNKAANAAYKRQVEFENDFYKDRSKNGQ